MQFTYHSCFADQSKLAVLGTCHLHLIHGGMHKSQRAVISIEAHAEKLELQTAVSVRTTESSHWDCHWVPNGTVPFSHLTPVYDCVTTRLIDFGQNVKTSRRDQTAPACSTHVMSFQLQCHLIRRHKSVAVIFPLNGELLSLIACLSDSDGANSVILYFYGQDSM